MLEAQPAYSRFRDPNERMGEVCYVLCGCKATSYSVRDLLPRFARINAVKAAGQERSQGGGAIVSQLT